MYGQPALLPSPFNPYQPTYPYLMFDEQQDEVSPQTRRYNTNVQSGIQQIGQGNMNLQGNIQQVNRRYSNPQQQQGNQRLDSRPNRAQLDDEATLRVRAQQPRFFQPTANSQAQLFARNQLQHDQAQVFNRGQMQNDARSQLALRNQLQRDQAQLLNRGQLQHDQIAPFGRAQFQEDQLQGRTPLWYSNKPQLASPVMRSPASFQDQQLDELRKVQERRLFQHQQFARPFDSNDQLSRQNRLSDTLRSAKGYQAQTTRLFDESADLLNDALNDEGSQNDFLGSALNDEMNDSNNDSLLPV
jgi:hypothetical protein